MAVTISGSASVTINSGAVLGITSGTAVASTSGTSIDFTSIPSWVKRITVMLVGVSTSGTSVVQLRVGSSSTIQTTGYLGSNGAQTTGVGTGNSTTGAVLEQSSSAGKVRHGKIELCSFGSNTWVITGIIGEAVAAQIQYSGFSVAVSGVLDIIRITTVNGTDTFDAGSINILYE